MATTKWVIDTTHSEVQFKVKHMMISTVTGYFSDFNSTVETEGDDFTTAKVEFTADLSNAGLQDLVALAMEYSYFEAEPDLGTIVVQ